MLVDGWGRKRKNFLLSLWCGDVLVAAQFRLDLILEVFSKIDEFVILQKVEGMEGAVTSHWGAQQWIPGRCWLSSFPCAQLKFQDTAVMLSMEIKDYSCCGGLCHSRYSYAESTTVISTAWNSKIDAGQDLSPDWQSWSPWSTGFWRTRMDRTITDQTGAICVDRAAHHPHVFPQELKSHRGQLEGGFWERGGFGQVHVFSLSVIWGYGTFASSWGRTRLPSS